jgi:tRNA threonylcarbamoyladenosine biosynthesis protein TsaB
MSLILSIETATSVCSVSLHQKGRLLALHELDQENAHGKKLLLLIDDLFKYTNLNSSDLSAIAVSSGPGSYTGLRIGVSIAKGLAYAHNLRIISVDSLHAMAHLFIDIAGKNDTIIPMIDARRMEVYTSIFSSTGELINGPYPLIIEDNPFMEYLKKGKVFFVGDGVGKLREVLEHENAVFPNLLSSSRAVGEIAYRKYLINEFVDTAYFEPNYLKDFKVIASKKNLLNI